MLEGDIHEDARRWFALKRAKGEEPTQLVGGPLDGLDYYEIDLDGVRYWITKAGLLDPLNDTGN